MTFDKMIEKDVFGERDYIVRKEHIREFRAKMLEEMTINCNEYHPEDVKRIRENDEICRRYIRHKKLKIEYALDMAKKSLKWRKEIGANDITKENITQDYLTIGGMFPFGLDKFGSHTLMFRARLHRKNTEMLEEMKRYLVYWLDRVFYEFDAVRVTFIFDSVNSGMANLDLELVKFLIAVFKEYYPWALGYIIVHDMPWILNTVWRMIKGWLPQDGLERVKFTDSNSILDFVDVDQLPLSMGGVRSLPFGEYTPDQLDELCPKITVNSREVPWTPEIEEYYKNYFNTFRKNIPSVPQNVFVSCNPCEELLFPSKREDEECSLSLSLTNVHDRHIAFKIKTNYIEGYRVKPFFGIIPMKETVSVVVTLVRPEPNPGDKLLVVTTELESLDITPLQLMGRWAKLPKSETREHRVRCVSDTILKNEMQLQRTDSSEEYQSLGPGVSVQDMLVQLSGVTKDLQKQMSMIQKNTERMENRMHYTTWFSVMIAALLIANLVFLFVTKYDDVIEHRGC